MHSSVTLKRRFPRFSGSQSGQATAWFVAISFLLFGILAFAIDVGFWFVDRRHAQNQVDASVLAGAQHLPASAGSLTPAVNAADKWLNRNNRIGQIVVVSECGIDAGEGYDLVVGGFAFADTDDDDLYDKIRACVRRRGFLLFSRILSLTDIKITAVAAASLIWEPARYALMAMNPDDNCDPNDGWRSLYTHGNANVVLGDEGSSYTATPCEDRGLAVEGTSILEGGLHDICGSTADDSSGGLDPSPARPGICDLPDPWVTYEQPVPGACIPGTKNDPPYFFNDGESHVIDPGTYCHTLDIQSGSQVMLNPGVYIFRDGVSVSAGGVLTSADPGVLLYLTCNNPPATECNGSVPGVFNVSGGSLDLAAMDCADDGVGGLPDCPDPAQEPHIVLWIDRTASQAAQPLVQINGNGEISVNGHIYNWGGSIFLAGTESTDNWSFDGTMLGDRIDFAGNATYTITWDDDFPPKLAALALVE